VGFAGMLLAEPLITLVYGSQYSESALGFQILIWLVAATLINGHYMYSLIAFNKQWFELLSAACGAGTNLLLCLLLIPRFGLSGAAWALLCTEIVTWGLNYYFVRREIITVRFFRHLLRPLMAGIMMAAGILLMPSGSVFIVGMTAVILYGLGLFVLQPNMLNNVRALIVRQ
jgi:O-antigen/teichoic acid export membrane protein